MGLPGDQSGEVLHPELGRQAARLRAADLGAIRGLLHGLPLAIALWLAIGALAWWAL